MRLRKEATAWPGYWSLLKVECVSFELIWESCPAYSNMKNILLKTASSRFLCYFPAHHLRETVGLCEDEICRQGNVSSFCELGLNYGNFLARNVSGTQMLGFNKETQTRWGKTDGHVLLYGDSRAFAPYKFGSILQSVTEVNRFGIRRESPKCHEASDIAALLDARFTTSQTPLSLDLASVCERLKACEHANSIWSIICLAYCTHEAWSFQL